MKIGVRYGRDIDYIYFLFWSFGGLYVLFFGEGNLFDRWVDGEFFFGVVG